MYQVTLSVRLDVTSRLTWPAEINSTNIVISCPREFHFSLVVGDLFEWDFRLPDGTSMKSRWQCIAQEPHRIVLNNTVYSLSNGAWHIRHAYQYQFIAGSDFIRIDSPFAGQLMAWRALLQLFGDLVTPSLGESVMEFVTALDDFGRPAHHSRQQRTSIWPAFGTDVPGYDEMFPTTSSGKPPLFYPRLMCAHQAFVWESFHV